MCLQDALPNKNYFYKWASKWGLDTGILNDGYSGNLTHPGAHSWFMRPENRVRVVTPIRDNTRKERAKTPFAKQAIRSSSMDRRQSVPKR